MFQRSFSKESSMGVQVRLKGISSSLNWGTGEIERSSTGVSGKFQGCFKELSKNFNKRVFERNSKMCFKKV